MNEIEPTEDQIIEAIMEMAEQQYLCTIIEHDPASDDLLVAWQDHEERDWEVWLTRHFLEECFTNVVLN